MKKKPCIFTWYTGTGRRAQHKCSLEVEHDGPHKCSSPCLATKSGATPVPVPEVEDEEIAAPSPTDTHIVAAENVGLGVTLALCGARRQVILGAVRGCKFDTVDAATCPVCKKANKGRV